QPGKGLALHVLRVFREIAGGGLGVKLVGFCSAKGEDGIKIVAKQLSLGSGGDDEPRRGETSYLWLLVGETQLQRRTSARGRAQTVERRSFRSDLLRINSITISMHDIIVDSIFDVGCAILASKQLPGVGFILSKKKLRFSFAEEPAFSMGLVLYFDYSRSRYAVFLGNAESWDRA